MKTSRWLVAIVMTALAAGGAHGQTRTVARSGDDLPPFTYQVQGSAAEVLSSSPKQFEAFAGPVGFGRVERQARDAR